MIMIVVRRREIHYTSNRGSPRCHGPCDGNRFPHQELPSEDPLNRSFPGTPFRSQRLYPSDMKSALGQMQKKLTFARRTAATAPFAMLRALEVDEPRRRFHVPGPPRDSFRAAQLGVWPRSAPRFWIRGEVDSRPDLAPPLNLIQTILVRKLSARKWVCTGKVGEEGEFPARRQADFVSTAENAWRQDAENE